MIRLFRKIREKLLTENKIKTYLLYGFGEVILVMLGILLAFQANEWAQDKANEQLELELISEIHQGLLSDLKDVQINLRWHHSILKGQKKSIDWVESDLAVQDSTGYHITMALKASSFLESTAPFESLKAYGLNRIKDTNMKERIIRIHDHLYPTYSSILKNYLSLNNETQNAGALYLDQAIDYIQWDEIGLKNIDQMKQDEFFHFQLKKLSKTNIALIYFNNEMEDELIKLIYLIEEKLDIPREEELTKT